MLHYVFVVYLKQVSANETKTSPLILMSTELELSLLFQKNYYYIYFRMFSILSNVCEYVGIFISV